MYEAPRTWWFELGDEYHATPRCPQIAPKDRRRLKISQGPPLPSKDGFHHYWPCEACCPSAIFVAPRVVKVIPVTFHTDENCKALKAESAGIGQPNRYPEVDVWPGPNYEILHDRDMYRACPLCTADTSVLYPLGSAQRPNREAA
jgi:hypothetical protein